MNPTSSEEIDISNIIYQELTSESDKLFTLQEIYDIFYERFELVKKLELREEIKRKVQIAFFTIEGEYDNIYRVTVGSTNYLIASLRNKMEILKEVATKQPKPLVNKTANDEKEILSFASKEDYVKLIKCFIAEKNFSFMYDGNLLDGVNHPIQILILNNEYDTILQLCDLTTVDFSVKNSQGKNCLEMATENNNCKILRYILEKNYEVKITNLYKLNESLKDVQKQNYDKITELKARIESIELDHERLDELNFLNNVYKGIILILIILFFKYASFN